MQLRGTIYVSQENDIGVCLYHDKLALLILCQNINTEFKFTMRLFDEQITWYILFRTREPIWNIVIKDQLLYPSPVIAQHYKELDS